MELVDNVRVPAPGTSRVRAVRARVAGSPILDVACVGAGTGAPRPSRHPGAASRRVGLPLRRRAPAGSHGCRKWGQSGFSGAVARPGQEMGKTHSDPIFARRGFGSAQDAAATCRGGWPSSSGALEPPPSRGFELDEHRAVVTGDVVQLRPRRVVVTRVRRGFPGIPAQIHPKPLL